MSRRPAATKIAFARSLRRNMTFAETILWRVLRGSRLAGYKFRRQVPVGIYVADFLCVRESLIVELDGAPHDDPDQRAHDLRRDIWLRQEGYRILRLPNDLVIGTCDLAVEQILHGLRNDNG
jgi:very-short-patch-repair endonuclease